MNRQLHHHILYAAVTILWCLLSVAACDSAGRRAAMLAVLEEADSLNRNYILITSDSLLREAVDYFDHHGTPNERLRAHYLLGCAYRDMGEAPRAIEAWQDGITCADTTAADCDYGLLCRVSSQMAEIFYHQNLMNENLKYLDQSIRYANYAHDSLAAVKDINFGRCGIIVYFCSHIVNRRWHDLQVSDENLRCILKESYNIDSPKELTVLEKQQRNTILKTCAQRERASAKSHVSQV